MSKAKGKTRKPLERTLGKAPTPTKSSNEDGPNIDLSHVRLPIETSLFGLKQALNLFATATDEVKNYITYECEVMYECRICRTIFRSLANFILHKRNYCTDRYYANFKRSSELDSDIKLTDNEENCDSDNEMIEERPKLQSGKKTLENVMNQLIERQKMNEEAKEIIKETLDSPEKDEKKDVPQLMVFEKIQSNSAAVFQTATTRKEKKDVPQDFMKSQVMEIHGILDSDEAILGPDGKISIGRRFNSPRINFHCPECKLTFLTRKTLTSHIKYKHNNTKMVYICPDCRNTFANAWGVYRHLMKVHRKTPSQIKRMREQVHNNVIRREDEEKSKSNDSQIVEKCNSNQWADVAECVVQMCEGCGKRFERRAALNSHSQMCMKRLLNKEKRKKEDKSKESLESAQEMVKIKGAAKRKPNSIILYQKPLEVIEILDDVEENNLNEDTDREEKDLIKIEELSTNNDVILNNNEDHLDKSSEEPIEIEKVLIAEVKEECSNKDLAMTEVLNDSSIDTLDKIDTKQLNDDKKSAIESVDKEKKDEVKSFDISLRRHKREKKIKHREKEERKKHRKLRKLMKKKKMINDGANENRTCDGKAIENVDDILEEIEKAIKNLDTSKEGSPTNDSNKSNSLDQNVDTKKLEENNKISTSPLSYPISNSEVLKIIGAETMENHLSSQETSLKDSSDCLMEEIKLESPEICYEANDDGPAELENMVAKSFVKSETLADTSETKSMPNLFQSIKVENNGLKDDETETCTKNYLKRRRLSVPCSSSNEKLPKTENNSTTVNLFTKSANYINRERLECVPCNMTFNNMDLLMWHMSNHFSWFHFQCDQCTYYSYSDEQCEDHISMEHNGVGTVLPLPYWKTLVLKHEFRLKTSNLQDSMPRNQSNLEKVFLKPTDKRSEFSTSPTNEDFEDFFLTMNKHVVDQQDPLADNSSNNSGDSAYDEVGNKDGEQQADNRSRRPVRNRSKILPSDFVYDMRIVRGITNAKQRKK